MKRCWILLALPFAAAAFVWLAGVLVGPHYSVSSALQVEAPPEAIWNALEAVDNYPTWRSEVANVEVKSRKPSLDWIEYDLSGRAANYTDEGAVSPGKWIRRITSGTLAKRASQTFFIVPMEGGGTRIAVTEEGEIGNPLERFRYRFQTGYGADLERFVGELRKRLGE